MSGFYVSLIFFGILLVLFSFVCIFLDRKKVFQFDKNFEDKKNELVEIINDAEQMIEELNKFSDYIVTQLDVKNEELARNLNTAEDRVNELSEKAKSVICDMKTGVDAAAGRQMADRILVANKARIAAVPEEEETMMTQPTEEIGEIAVNSGVQEVSSPSKAAARKNEKIIPINNKYTEVIRLSQEGLYGYEIAKRLNMGKGEVELILGLRK